MTTKTWRKEYWKLPIRTVYKAYVPQQWPMSQHIYWHSSCFPDSYSTYQLKQLTPSLEIPCTWPIFPPFDKFQTPSNVSKQEFWPQTEIAFLHHRTRFSIQSSNQFMFSGGNNRWLLRDAKRTNIQSVGKIHICQQGAFQGRSTVNRKHFSTKMRKWEVKLHFTAVQCYHISILIFSEHIQWTNC
jgi:hypothetical protein